MATKQAYQDKLAAQLKEWDARIDVWKAKAQKATAEARINYEDELESLKGKRLAAQTMLEDLCKRGEIAWDDLKIGADRAWDELNKAMEHVAARFK